jgi:sialidase-1
VRGRLPKQASARAVPGLSGERQSSMSRWHVVFVAVAALVAAAAAPAGHAPGGPVASSRTQAPPPPFALFSSGDLNVTEYRIPVLVALHHGETLLAFAEARLPCVQSCGKSAFWGDSSPKHIAFRRSENAGVSWTPTQFIVKSDGTNDNLNLGNAVVDDRTNAVLLQWGGCVHCSCVGTEPKPAPGACVNKNAAGNVKQIRSTDSGKTWGPVEDISSQVLDPTLSPIFKLGEGSGLQLKTGTLVVCGRISNLSPRGCHRTDSALAKAGGSGDSNCGSACILSEDGGVTWARGGGVPSTAEFGDNECEPALLKNGSVLLNMRAGQARLLARSDDGGKSFVDVHPALDLSPVANCQGSMQPVTDGTLLFTAPAGSAARRNLSLAVSTNQGVSWGYVQVVHDGPSAYSSLAPRTGAPGSGRCAALLFEGGADPEASTYQHIYFTNVCV